MTPLTVNRLRGAVAGACVWLAVGGLAHAQATQAPEAELRPAEIQRLFDAYLVMEAQQALGLSEAQYPGFLMRLRTLQETRRQHQRARSQILAELARMTAPRAAVQAEDSAIRERLAALQELDSRSAAENRKAQTELDALLDPRQQARFRVFEEQVERRKLELMLRARQNARQGSRARPPRRQ
jgi:hypothetical protein